MNNALSIVAIVIFVAVSIIWSMAGMIPNLWGLMVLKHVFFG